MNLRGEHNLTLAHVRKLVARLKVNPELFIRIVLDDAGWTAWT
jgi:hypothetical protein